MVKLRVRNPKIGLILFPFLLACIGGEGEEALIIFHDGNLSGLMGELAGEFKKIHPGIEIHREASESTLAARKVAEVRRAVDIVAVMDHKVIEKVLMNRKLFMPDYADWYIDFARDRVVIAFTDASRYSDKVSSDNWYRILSREDVRFGCCHQDIGHCGYHTLMTWHLADLFYKDRPDGKSIYNTLYEACSPDSILPSSDEMVSLLGSSALDYAFMYLSTAKQHRLKYIELPRGIDLSDLSLGELYENAQVRLTGKRPDSYNIVRGAPIVYAITIPKGAPDLKHAVMFVEFMLSEKGRKIMERNGHLPIVPVMVKGLSRVPKEFREYASQH
jgi:molybdate/tungstate transport system substrate-binding protein